MSAVHSSLSPHHSRLLEKRRRGRAGWRSTPLQLIRVSQRWSPAHLTSINPTDTAESTSRRAALPLSHAMGNHHSTTFHCSWWVWMFSILTPDLCFRFVLAIVDSGACVSLMGVSIFYRRCPATSLYLASYPPTPSGAEPTALVPVSGTCVPHSKAQGGTPPRMHCNAEGEWMVPVGGCVCDEGYEPNVNGSACLGKSEENWLAWFLILASCALISHSLSDMSWYSRSLGKNKEWS